MTMHNRILRCRECGKHYFNWKKLTDHLIQEHGYSIPLEPEPKEGLDGKDTERSDSQGQKDGQS